MCQDTLCIPPLLHGVWVTIPWSAHWPLCFPRGGRWADKKPVGAPLRDSFLRPQAWEELLRGDPDRSFLLEGVSEGFNIVDAFDFVPAEVDNYISATCPENREVVESCITNEITEGRYVVVSTPPTVISALGAVPKPDGGVRLIHDGSRPLGKALNDYAQLDTKMRFQTLDDATDLLTPGAFMGKVDLKSAYRSVRTHPSNWQACGLKWRFPGDRHFTYMYDTALPFGSRHAPGIFHRLTQAVRRMMARLGFTGVVVYLDDFLLIEKSPERCRLAMNTLLSLLRYLGFSIAWHKVEGPTQKITFLGVMIDSVQGCLELPPQKLAEFHELVRTTLELKRISLKQLQHLAGKLNWASAVVRGGRIYLRRVLDLMRPLHQSRHKALIPPGMRADLQWWVRFLDHFNGKTWLSSARRWVNVYVDASTRGCGMVWGSDWLYVNWEVDSPHLATEHINVKETLAIALAVKRWAPLWAGCSVVIHSDNITALCALNKGSSKSALSMDAVRDIFWLSAVFNFRIRGVHIAGVDNEAADAVSRLHAGGSLHRMERVNIFEGIRPLLPFCWPYYFLCHMSFNSFLLVCRQVLRWIQDWRSWIT